MVKRFGASSDDWALLDTVCGLTAHLLPVVSNPHATKSPRTTLVTIGKIPSIYDKMGQVVGISKWTARQSTSKDIEQWSKQPDFGICVQTREIRALDIDVEGAGLSAEIVKEIADFCDLMLPAFMPLRTRANSGKCLLAFKMVGHFPKRHIKVDGGIIEFLGDGQQFIAYGTHPSGSRYEWETETLDSCPVVAPELFETLWGVLEAKFGIAPSVTSQTHAARRPTLAGVVIEDETLDKLEQGGHVSSWGNEGQAFITCPFAAEHTTESGGTDTAYFPKGGRGYEQGHFKCLHAHCQGRSDVDFLDGFGLRNYFGDITQEVNGDTESGGSSELTVPWPKLLRKKGKILPTLENIIEVLKRPDICGEDIRFDEFRDEIMCAATAGQWRSFIDTDYTWLRLRLEQNKFLPLSSQLLREAIHAVAGRRAFDSAVLWLGDLVWDGVPRVSTFLSRYFEVANDDYSESVSTYLWTALAGRVMHPGVKADMVPVLIGAQGIGKSFGVSELVPSKDFYDSINLTDRDDNLSRRMRGKLVLEIGELRGLHSREMESIKDFITRTDESWVPKYQEFSRKYPRRGVFIGTTNEKEFLADPTGNRRWLPVMCGTVDIAGLQADRLQLWAEGRELFRQRGVCWQHAQRLAPAVHDDHQLMDTWEEMVTTWLDMPDELDGGTPRTRGDLSIIEIAKRAIGLEPSRMRKGDEMRLANVLKKAGMTRIRSMVGGKRTVMWSA